MYRSAAHNRMTL